MKIDALTSNMNIDLNKTSNTGNGESFGNYLKSALDSVNDAQVNANQEIMNVITGEGDIHQALIAAEEARLQMELTVQIRNKILESYQDITKMQI
jgi:flagellar hook-basal body complex protein FliE